MPLAVTFAQLADAVGYGRDEPLVIGAARPGRRPTFLARGCLPPGFGVDSEACARIGPSPTSPFCLGRFPDPNPTSHSDGPDTAPRDASHPRDALSPSDTRPRSAASRDAALRLGARPQAIAPPGAAQSREAALPVGARPHDAASSDVAQSLGAALPVGAAPAETAGLFGAVPAERVLSFGAVAPEGALPLDVAPPVGAAWGSATALLAHAETIGPGHRLGGGFANHAFALATTPNLRLAILTTAGRDQRIEELTGKLLDRLG